MMLAMTLSFAPAVVDEACARVELSDIDAQQPTIRQVGTSIIIYGAVGKTVSVYNLLGVQLQSIYIDTYEKRIELGNLPRGIYPIKIGNFTKKIKLFCKIF